MVVYNEHRRGIIMIQQEKITDARGGMRVDHKTISHPLSSSPSR